MINLNNFNLIKKLLKQMSFRTVLFLVILALVFLLKQYPETLCGTIAIYPFWPDSRNLYLPILLERLRCAQWPCWAMSLPGSV